MVDNADIPYRIPAGIAYLWGPKKDAATARLQNEASSEVDVLATDLIACTPRSGSIDVIDAVLRVVQSLLDNLPAENAPHRNQLSALVFPGTLERRGESLRLLSDGLLDDLRRSPPGAPENSVLLTGHANQELETPWEMAAADTYLGPSGRSRTIWHAQGAGHSDAHYRNPRVLRLASPWVEPEAMPRFEEALSGFPHVRVVGPLGVGKSRLVAESLEGRPQLWSRCWPKGSGGPTIAAQLLRHAHNSNRWANFNLPPDLADQVLSPWQGRLDEADEATLVEALKDGVANSSEETSSFLIIDDLHAADRTDRETVESLIAMSGKVRPRLVLISRPAGWDQKYSDSPELPTVILEPLGGEEEAELVEKLTKGLAIPPEVKERFSEAAAGNPFAFEEGLHNLVRRRFLRENYGNFFFSGPKDVQYRPTARLARHLISEAMRADGLATSFRLASAMGPTQKEFLAFADDLEDTHIKRLIEVGLVSEETIGGQKMVDFAHPAYRAGFRQCLEDHVIQRLRGDLLEPMLGGTSAEHVWTTYQNLAGTPKGTDALLEVLALEPSKRPSDGLFEAIERELSAHRQRKGDPSTEFELLWAYLPLARKFAEPTTLIPAIERALDLCSPGEPRRTALLALHSEEALVQGELERAEQQAVEGLDLARKQDPRRQSLLLLQLGKVLQRQDRLPEAKRLLLDLLNSMNPKDNPSQAAACHYHLGNIYLREQDYEQALENHRVALRQRKQRGTPTALGHSLSALATLNLAIGNYSQSLLLYEEAEDALTEAQDPVELSFPLSGKGRALSRLGDFEGATAPLKEALELRKRRSDKIGIEISKLMLARNDLDLGKIEQALQEARLALFRLTMIGSVRYRGDAESLIGQLQLRCGHPEKALLRLDEAALHHRRAGAEVDGLFDESFALEACLELRQVSELERRGQILAERLAVAPYPELGERLDLSLYRAWKTLGDMGEQSGDPSVPLQRAYRELVRKTALLEPERRSRFLLEVPANHKILDLAKSEGLATSEELDRMIGRQERESS